MRRLCLGLLAAGALLVPACAGDGHISLLGYTTRPNYDTTYKTIKIPMIRSRSNFTVTPTIGLEMDLHRALVREVPLRTPYRVAHCDADTELSIKIRSVQKGILNYAQQNNIREAEIRLEVEMVWRDLRTGKALTRAAPRPGAPLLPGEREPLIEGESVLPDARLAVPGRPGNQATARADEEPIIDPATRQVVVPVIVRAAGYYRPELGESTTTAMQRAMDQIAVQILQALEVSWANKR